MERKSRAPEVSRSSGPGQPILQPPVAYQGGKQRIADVIVGHLKVGGREFVNVCCGSGAVSLAAIRSGVPCHRVTMVDAGPWGLFWRSIGDGSFDVDVFARYVSAVPLNTAGVQAHIEKLAAQPVDADAIYVFLLLQAASFGGKAIWIKDGRWANTSFRSYWLPTATSNRRSPVNPMMPMPRELLRRVRLIAERAKGVRGVHADAASLPLREGAVVYIDPPYKGTTAYGCTLDAVKLANRLGGAWISEGVRLSDSAVLISGGRSKGGISARRAQANEEWLSFVGADSFIRGRTSWF